MLRLVDLLSHPNGWFVERARVELAHRRDPALVPRLREMALAVDDGRLALEGLWALHASAELDEATVGRLLAHPYPYVRAWTVRLLGDRRKASPAVHRQLLALAERDPSAMVRLQLAASVKRLSGEHGLPIVERLLARDLDDGDERITWSLWWAIEDKALTDSNRLLKFFADPAAWEIPAHRDNIRRLIRRYAAEGSHSSYAWCLQLLEATPGGQLRSMHEHLNMGLAERSRTLPGVGQGGLFEQAAVVSPNASPSKGRTYEPLTKESKRYIALRWEQDPRDLLYTELARRAGVERACAGLKSLATDAGTSAANRLAALTLLQEFGQSDVVEPMLTLVCGDQADSVKRHALDALVRKHWGNIGPGTPEEKLATMRRYGNNLRAPAAATSRAAGNCSPNTARYATRCTVRGTWSAPI